jgi:hypothetical protein
VSHSIPKSSIVSIRSTNLRSTTTFINEVQKRTYQEPQNPVNSSTMFSVKSSTHPAKKQNSAALTTSAKKRFSARLRKIRWSIYKNIRSRKRNVMRILCRYKKLVNKFLETFSSKLKPREISIWKEKLAKTCGDVQAVLRKGKETKPQCVKKVKEDQPTQKCNCCPIMSNYAVRLDSVLVKIYALLNLVQADQTQAEATFSKPEFHKAPAKEIDEVHKPVKAENSIEEFDTEDEEISEAPAADEIVDKNNATVKVESKRGSLLMLSLSTPAMEKEPEVAQVEMSVTCGEDPAHAVRVLRGGQPEGQLDDDDPDAAVTLVNMLNGEKTNDGCYAISRDEQFRRSAMAFYKQPKSLK